MSPGVHGLLCAAARTAPERPAISDPAGGWTYAELLRHSRSVAAWLGRQGARPGDRVVVLSPNRREVAALGFGCSMAGCLFVPLHPATRSWQLGQILADAEPVLIVAAAELIERVAASGTAVRIHRIDEVFAVVGDGVGGAPVRHEVFALLYTSGSTGTSKAVVCPHSAVLFAVESIGVAVGYRPEDTVYSALPLSFDYGFYQILLCCRAGCALVVAPAGAPMRMLAGIRASAATVVPVVPSLARVLITLCGRDPDASTVRLFTNTGDTLTPMLTAGLRACFPGARIVLMFGITECKRISIAEPDADVAYPSALGWPLPGTRVEVLDADGVVLGPNAVGEFVVSGPHVMAGYWRAPELTARIFRRDGQGGAVRLRTGDFGWLDERGHLHFVGRRDNIFKRRGVRMSTTEIEAAALAIPGVRAAVVLPPRDGRDLTLCAIADLSPDRLLAELTTRLEPAKVPAVCRLVDEIPLTLNGKPARDRLAELIGVR